MNIIKLRTGAAEDKLSEVLDRVEKIRRNDDLLSVLKESQEKYGVKHISYAGFNMGDLTLVEPISVWTYKPEWIDHYRQRGYLNVDPVVKAVPKSILPVDWNQFDLNDTNIRRFFAEAREAGVGNQGLSIPVRGRSGEFSIFSLTFEESEKDWQEYKRQFMRDFQVLAVFFHQSALQAFAIEPPNFNLSTRELEVLYWAACGKTSEETAVILGITKRSVRFHCANILTKMNAMNIAHAVAKGIYYNLLNAPR
jgi:DNA-binding CsgD family transcriptional regulator